MLINQLDDHWKFWGWWIKNDPEAATEQRELTAKVIWIGPLVASGRVRQGTMKVIS